MAGPQPRSHSIHFVLRFAGYTVLVYVALALGLFLAQRSMIFFPSREAPELRTYGAEGVMQTVRVETADGLSLTGWLAPPGPDKPIIVWFHGNAADHGARFYFARPYIEAGYGVLLAGYRGYGGNPGNPSEIGFYRDGRAWINSLLETGIPPDRMVLYGESIGTGVATQMALEHPDALALVLQSPYTSLPDVARTRYFFLPVDLMVRDRFRNIDKIGDVRPPVLIHHGKRDNIVPVTHGQRLFDAARSPGDIQVYPGSGHNDLPATILAAKTIDFLGTLSPGPSALR